ncbi:MAG: hypothetical protein HQK58_14260 [Deltaproteobacteria bacterium]|nr:hypothetical protein [Deltaproteobacteria bacterium]
MKCPVCLSDIDFARVFLKKIKECPHCGTVVEVELNLKMLFLMTLLVILCFSGLGYLLYDNVPEGFILIAGIFIVVAFFLSYKLRVKRGMTKLTKTAPRRGPEEEHPKFKKCRFCSHYVPVERPYCENCFHRDY